MRAESGGAARRTPRRRRGIPFRVQVGLVVLVALAIGYGLGYYAIAMLTMPHASTGETTVSTPRSTPAPAAGATASGGAAGSPAASSEAPAVPATAPPAAPAGNQEEAPAGAAPAAEGGLYRVQVGAFSDRERAQALVDRLIAQGFEAGITSGPPYRVQAGAFRNEAGAAARLQELREAGYTDAFVQRSLP